MNEGVCHSDWKQMVFADVLRRVNGKPYQIGVSEYELVGRYPVVDQGKDAIVAYSNQDDKVFHVPDGGVIVFGDHTCIIKYVDEDFVVGGDGPQVLVAKDVHCTKYLYYYLLLHHISPTGYNRHYQLLVEGEFTLPSPEEQYAIVAILSDIDNTIASLERLVAKKKDIRRGVVHQLMTAKIRLPSHDEKWNLCRLDEVIAHHSGNSTLIKGKLTKRYMLRTYPAYSASGQDVWHSTYEHQGDALIVSAVGSRCGRVFEASGKWSAIANTHVIWPDKTKIDIRFLRHCVDDEAFWTKAGTGQPYILFNQSLARIIMLPSLDEQEAIADALDDLDYEIAALASEADKMSAIKQGMMQQLLTGRIRLVEPESLPTDDAP